MTEKRFTLEEFGDKCVAHDNGMPMNARQVVEFLNALHEENEQLKQFKEDVFNKIDMHLRMLPTARDTVNGEYGDPSLYNGAIYMLETLKKELEND